MLFIIFISIALLAGCMGAGSTKDAIYEKLEKVVELEENFEKQQEPLVTLERNEKEIYNEILALGMKEFEKIKELSTEAIAIVEKRREHIKEEEASIAASKEEFATLVPIIEKIQDPAMKEEANLLYDVMMERYGAHEQLTSYYLKGLDYDKELYEIFQKEELAREELEEQITKVNEAYKMVLESNKQFNDKTTEYNKIKKQLYQEMGMELATE